MSAIAKLAKVMPPPLSPCEVPSGEGWRSIEDVLKFRLPNDYKEFIASYGTGKVDGSLWILNPFSHNSNLNLLGQSVIRLEAQRRFSKMSGRTSRYALYPDTNGLFPWGITDNGDVAYWLQSKLELNGSIVVCDCRASDWFEFSYSMVEFLELVLTKKLVVDVFPDDFPSDSPEFTPFRELSAL